MVPTAGVCAAWESEAFSVSGEWCNSAEKAVHVRASECMYEGGG